MPAWAWGMVAAILALWWGWSIMAPERPGGAGMELRTPWGWPDTDEEWVARTVWGEAAADEDAPQLVLDVIVNRHRQSGKTWKDVVLDPYGFSVWLPWLRPEDEAVTPAMRRNLERTVQLHQPPRFELYRAWARQAVRGTWQTTLPPEVTHYAERASWEAFWQRPNPRHWWYQYREYPTDRRYSHVFLVRR